MEIIFHEKQQGALCAQHCLNALLQGPYFNAVDLATIGHKFDEEERRHMAEAGLSSEEYNRFLQEPSSNVDDSGYFSVQVITAALSVWGLDLVPFNSSDPRAIEARQCPTNEYAFICHYRDHWFAIRKIGTQWFNLNSLLSGPELLSDTYLSLFLAQLQTDNYSIFVVVGNLPNSEADRILLEKPLSPRLFRKAPVPKVIEVEEDDDDLKAALALSREEMEAGDDQEALNKAILQSLQSSSIPIKKQIASPEDEELKRAINMSLEVNADGSEPSPIQPVLPPSSGDPVTESVEFIRQRRLMRLEQASQNSSSQTKLE